MLEPQLPTCDARVSGQLKHNGGREAWSVVMTGQAFGHAKTAANLSPPLSTTKALF